MGVHTPKSPKGDFKSHACIVFKPLQGAWG